MYMTMMIKNPDLVALYQEMRWDTKRNQNFRRDFCGKFWLVEQPTWKLRGHWKWHRPLQLPLTTTNLSLDCSQFSFHCSGSLYIVHANKTIHDIQTEECTWCRQYDPT